MTGQHYNPFSFLMVLGLLSFAPADTINRGLESLSLALDSTAKSLESVKMGMDTLDNGLQQFAQHTVGNDTKTSDFNGSVSNDHNNSASVMPADSQNNQNNNGNGGDK